MTLHYTLTREDFIRYVTRHARNSKSMSKSLLLPRLALPASLAFTLIAVDNKLLWGAVLVVVSVLWVFLMPVFFHRTLARRARNETAEGKADSRLGECVTTIEGGRITARFGKDADPSARPLSRVARLESDEHSLYVYMKEPDGTLIVPRSAFESREQEDEFASLVTSRIKSADN